ncbi:MlaD family protein [Acetobacteraceae bacterium ESL0709]|nr:MlaD family protein [Acetobacteraceae bacterium ESL0697]MDF7678205.1 MlaD family protein [Acetobacteraceae bacterium ESL0709]
MLHLHRESDTATPLFRNRYADEWVGLLVLAAMVLFTAAVIETGLLRQWLSPSLKIHFVLPQSGVAGLAVGNDIEVMGVHAGEIRALELNDSGRMYAEGTIEPQFKRFIRKDSVATIRRRFVVAGASYIELTRGYTDNLDWAYAVVKANVEANPADQITKMVNELKARLVPAMTNVQSITEQIDGLIKDMRAGKGSVGAFMTQREIYDRANMVLGTLNNTITQLQPLEKQLHATFSEANATMKNVHKISGDLKNSTPDMKKIIHNTAVTSDDLPALIIEAQASATSLKKLMDQMRSLWILGGSGSKRPSHRLPAKEVRP